MKLRIATWNLGGRTKVAGEQWDYFDRLFVSDALKSWVVGCSVFNDDPKLASRTTGSLSDHHPVVLELEL